MAGPAIATDGRLNRYLRGHRRPSSLVFGNDVDDNRPSRWFAESGSGIWMLQFPMDRRKVLSCGTNRTDAYAPIADDALSTVRTYPVPTPRWSAVLGSGVVILPSPVDLQEGVASSATIRTGAYAAIRTQCFVKSGNGFGRRPVPDLKVMCAARLRCLDVSRSRWWVAGGSLVYSGRPGSASSIGLTYTGHDQDAPPLTSEGNRTTTGPAMHAWRTTDGRSIAHDDGRLRSAAVLEAPVRYSEVVRGALAAVVVYPATAGPVMAKPIDVSCRC